MLNIPNVASNTFTVVANLVRPSVIKGDAGDRFEVVDYPCLRSLEIILSRLGRDAAEGPARYVTREELALAEAGDPVNLCRHRALRPLREDGPERFGTTVADVVGELLDVASKDVTRGLGRALDFAAVAESDAVAAGALSAAWPWCSAGPDTIRAALVEAVALTPATLRPLLVEARGDSPERAGARELAFRLLDRGPECFAGAVAGKAVDEIVGILAEGPVWNAGFVARLLAIVRVARPRRTPELLLALFGAQRSTDAHLSRAADETLAAMLA